MADDEDIEIVDLGVDDRAYLLREIVFGEADGINMSTGETQIGVVLRVTAFKPGHDDEEPVNYIVKPSQLVDFLHIAIDFLEETFPEGPPRE